jgi:hypothetical protein
MRSFFVGGEREDGEKWYESGEDVLLWFGVVLILEEVQLYMDAVGIDSPARLRREGIPE